MVDHSKDHVSALYEIEVCDENGNVVESISGISDSFLQNFVLLLQAAMGNAAITVKDTAGVNRSCIGFSCLAATYGIKNCNIVVGTGVTAVTPTDYALAIQALTLEYAPLLLIPQPSTPVINGSNIESVVCRRTFNNNTGATINISELGIIVTSSTFPILILRDLLGAAIPVGDHQTLHITYTFRTAI